MRQSWKLLRVTPPGVRIPHSPLRKPNRVICWVFHFSEFIKSYKPKTELPYFLEILKSIQINFNYNSFNKIVNHNGTDKITDIKIESLDFLISYADFILEDNVISDTEIQDFTFLKRIFKIKEGDFSKYKNLEMNEILKKRIY